MTAPRAWWPIAARGGATVIQDRSDALHDSMPRHARAVAAEGALFFHATYVNPSWARKKVATAKLARHIFYR